MASNIFSSLQGVFRKDKNQMRAPQSNIGLYSRNQNSQLTNPNRSQAPKQSYGGTQSSNFYNPQSSQQRQTFRIVQPKATPAPAPQRPQATGLRGGGQFGISPAVSNMRPNMPTNNPTSQLQKIQQMAKPRMSMATPGTQQPGMSMNRPGEASIQTPTSPFDSLSSFYNTAEKNRLALEAEQLAGDTKFIEDSYGLSNKALAGQVPVLQENYDQFRNDVLAGISDEEAGTARDIESARTESGASQRELAESRRDLQGVRERQYGALGSIDSYGTGSFTQANANDDNNFLRMTNENLQKRADKIAGIETGLRQFKRQAQTMINSENAKVKSAIAAIQGDISMNELEKQNQIRQVYGAAKANKQSIMDEYNGYRMQLAQEKSAYEQEATGGLSQEFIQSGKPVTAKDFEFFVKNPKGIEAFQKMGGAPDGDKSRINSSIAELLSRDIGAVTGYGQYNPFNAMPGSDAQYTRAQLDQLKGLLSLDAREKLKGQGTITDAEMAMLDRSVAALNSNLSEQDMRTELTKIQSILNKGVQGGGAQNDPLGLGI